MAIRIERDPAFWQAIAEHPAVASAMFPGGVVPDLASTIADPGLLPLASEHGGFLFFQRDHLGRTFELHTLFLPGAWGRREIPQAAHEAFEALFLRGCDLCFTFQTLTNRHSKPPLSHGWQACGPFAPSPELAAEVRTWVLTREAWGSSPARRRFKCQLSQLLASDLLH